jgi:excisionase family DNA binding protein
MGTRYLTLEEFKAKYKVGRSTVYEWMGLGLPYFKVGRVVRYPEAEVEAWVQARTVGTTEARRHREAA